MRQLYRSPQTPLKLEANLKLGMYFNMAMKVTNDSKQLLPTTGVFFEFGGQLSVIAVSLAVATIYAVGRAALRFSADTKSGPVVDMKFGFGAEIVVGLPVIANVSVMYMVSIEARLELGGVAIAAFITIKGDADIFDGLIGITIMIEAKGEVSRIGGRTDLAAQLTFALDIEIAWVIDIEFSRSWRESRQIA